MSDWSTTWDLFGLAFCAALLAGAVIPLIGCFLFVRRTSFHGIVLPQFAAAGIACGFVLMPALGSLAGTAEEDVQRMLQDTHAALDYHMAWAALATFGGLICLNLLGRRGGSEVGRLAGAFAISSAAAVLFAHASPAGEVFVHELLRGEILFVGQHELVTLGIGLGCVLVAVAWLHRDLVLVSYDPDTARVLGKPVGALELLLQALTGIAVAVSVMTVGPVVLFGLLVLPPIAARPWARTMTGFLLLAGLLGLASAAGGLWASLAFDEPLGPCLVMASAVTAIPGVLRGTGAT